jgi:hypothetical protein
MFDLFNKDKTDPELLEIEEKLDKDLLEQLLYEFKDKRFYTESRSAATMAQVDLNDRSGCKELLHIDRFYEVLGHVEDTVDKYLMTEYNPSKKATRMIKSLRKCSLDAQVALFTLYKKKNRKQILKDNIDADVFVAIAEFKVSVCRVLNDIFETYDIRVYPQFRKKNQESLLAYQKQFSQKG